MRTIFLQFSRALALALAGMLVAAPAYADNDKGKGKDRGGKHQKQKNDKHADKDGQHKNRVRHFTDEHRAAVNTYYTQEHAAGRCPPGLAKKRNGCMPPGQAKKWREGQPLPTTVRSYPVPQQVLGQLPPPPVGHRYVRVGNDILLLSPREGLVVDVIRSFGLS